MEIAWVRNLKMILKEELLFLGSAKEYLGHKTGVLHTTNAALI
jgi:hypothetical protein